MKQTLPRNKIYFLSDAHLGAPYIKDPKAHEARLVHFLDRIKDDAKEIYFLGDIFDFWYEWKHIVPKGFIRFQGKVAELVDSGIKVHFFGGNHDMWMFSYFQKELGVDVYHQPTLVDIDGKTFFLAHGEDLGVDDRLFKAMLRLFRAPWFRWLFSTFVPPSWTMRFAKSWSVKSRKRHGHQEGLKYLGEDKENLVQFAKSHKSTQHIDYFIFGHRHIMLDLMLKKDSRVIILGDWIRHFSYAVVENGQLQLTDINAQKQ